MFRHQSFQQITDTEYYLFLTIDELKCASISDFRSCKTGFRDKYIYGIIQDIISCNGSVCRLSVTKNLAIIQAMARKHVLLIDADQDATTGWEGYDYLINQRVLSTDRTTLMRYDALHGQWIQVAELQYAVSGAHLEVAVPRKLIGAGGKRIALIRLVSRDRKSGSAEETARMTVDMLNVEAMVRARVAFAEPAETLEGLPGAYQDALTVIELVPTTENKYLLAQICFNLKKYQTVITILKQIYEDKKQEKEIDFYIGMSLALTDNIDEAGPYLINSVTKGISDKDIEVLLLFLSIKVKL